MAQQYVIDGQESGFLTSLPSECERWTAEDLYGHEYASDVDDNGRLIVAGYRTALMIARQLFSDFDPPGLTGDERYLVRYDVRTHTGRLRQRFERIEQAR